MDHSSLLTNKKALPSLDKASREKQPEHTASNFSLRWHYPDQVDWVSDKKVTLSARLPRAPHTLFSQKYNTLPQNPKIARSPLCEVMDPTARRGRTDPLCATVLRRYFDPLWNTAQNRTAVLEEPPLVGISLFGPCG
jgi:hypothetical protein